MHDYLEKFLLGKLNMDLLGDNTREKMMAELELKKQEMQMKFELRKQEMEFEAQLRGIEAASGGDISANIPRQ